MDIEGRREAGILMHITSLPGGYGIGDLGPSAYEFAHQLKTAGATLWQMLPLGPTGYGNSPYAQRSSFAGNELLISPDMLRMEGLLDDEDLMGAPDFPEGHVDFQTVEEWKLPLIRKAAHKALRKAKLRKEIDEFRKRESFWIEDYAMFMVLYDKYYDARWHTVWDDGESRRDPEVLSDIRKKYRKDIDAYVAMQYLFDMQIKELRKHVRELGIRIIGDIPIFAGADSADTWSHIELFKTDSKGHYSAVSGVPPDGFSPTGQLWGNPVYDWEVHEKTGFRWWKERIRRTLEMADIIRIDHFRGLDAYFEIKAGEKTAEHGKWRKSPGKKLLSAIKEEFGNVPIIAEDLGWITDSVRKLRDSFSLPGMKIAQDGFTMDAKGYLNTYDDFLPHNYTRRFVAYTGTHDNHTAKSWFFAHPDIEKHIIREYLSSPDDDIVWALIRAIMMSNADTVVIPMQDILELDDDARMNFPSTCNSKNWSWRMRSGAFDSYRTSRFSFLAKISGRNGLTAEEHLQAIRS